MKKCLWTDLGTILLIKSLEMTQNLGLRWVATTFRPEVNEIKILLKTPNSILESKANLTIAERKTCSPSSKRFNMSQRAKRPSCFMRPSCFVKSSCFVRLTNFTKLSHFTRPASRDQAVSVKP